MNEYKKAFVSLVLCATLGWLFWQALEVGDPQWQNVLAVYLWAVQFPGLLVLSLCAFAFANERKVRECAQADADSLCRQAVRLCWSYLYFVAAVGLARHGWFASSVMTVALLLARWIVRNQIEDARAKFAAEAAR